MKRIKVVWNQESLTGDFYVDNVLDPERKVVWKNVQSDGSYYLGFKEPEYAVTFFTAAYGLDDEDYHYWSEKFEEVDWQDPAELERQRKRAEQRKKMSQNPSKKH